jgi:TFIIF-interacting CTD phosphatase-like protein
MSQIYEVILYTSAEKKYADIAIDFMERKHKIFAHKLYKQQCLIKPKEYSFKSLDMLCSNRNINDLIIVDNSVKCFALSLRNGIPITDYKGTNSDKELIYLAKYLHTLAHVKDVRTQIKQDFAAFLLEHYQVS